MSQMGGTFVASVPAVPVGSMQAFAGSSAPTGWLLCNGTTASRTTYSNLFSVIGTTYGVGDGSTTFGLPDMRGRVPMGAGTGNQLNASGSGAILAGTPMTPRTAGAFGGEETHLLTSAEMPAHTHSPNGQPTFLTWDGGSLGYATGGGGVVPQGSPSTTGSTGGGGRHAVVPPFVVLNYVIKAIPDTPRGGMTATFTPPIVTSLPLVPQFGDQVVYAADATNGVYWLLQYDASGTYPWKFIGGAPLRASNTTYPAGQNTGSFTDITSGATVTAPLAGDYMVLHGGRTDSTNPTGSGLIEVCAATTTIVASSNDSAAIGFEANVTGVVRGAWQWDQKMSGVVLNEIIKLRQKIVVGSFNTVFFYTRINVTPIRVKAA